MVCLRFSLLVGLTISLSLATNLSFAQTPSPSQQDNPSPPPSPQHAQNPQTVVAQLIGRSGVLEVPIERTATPRVTGQTATTSYTRPEQVAGILSIEAGAVGNAPGPAANLDVLVLGADLNDQLFAVALSLFNTGLFASVTYVDGNLVLPTPTELQAFNAVFVYSNLTFLDGVQLGNNLADYIDSGGGVVTAVFSNASGDPIFFDYHIQGRFRSEGYFVMESLLELAWDGPHSLVTLDDAHPILAGVSSFSGGNASFRPNHSVTVNGTRIANWSDGQPLVAVNNIAGTKRADLGFFPVPDLGFGDWWDPATDGDLLMANALAWVARPPLNLVSPIGNAAVPALEVDFAWSGGAAPALLWVEDLSTNQIVFNAEATSPHTLTLSDQHQYQWQVQDINGNNQWSPIETFSVDLFTDLQSPIGNSVVPRLNVDFVWSGGAAPALLRVEDLSTNQIVFNAQTNSPHTLTLTDQRQYQWQVQDVNGNNQWYGPETFSIDVPPFPTLISPIGDTVVPTFAVEFVWSGGVSPALLRVEDLTNGKVFFVQTSSPHTLTLTDQNQYQWELRDINGDNQWYGPETFSIDVPNRLVLNPDPRPAPLLFDNAQLNATTKLPLELGNPGGGATLVTTLDLTGAFTLCGGPSLPFTVPGQGLQLLELCFTPTTIGPHIGRLTITHDGADDNGATVLGLAGTAVDLPSIALSAQRFDVRVPIGGTATVGLVISHPGNANADDLHFDLIEAQTAVPTAVLSATRTDELPTGVATGMLPSYPADSPAQTQAPNQLLVKFRPNASATQQLAVHDRLEAQVLKQWERIGVKQLQIPKDKDLQATLAAYRQDPAVEYAELNQMVFANATPNDPDFGQLWGLHNTGQTGGAADADIDAPEAWDKIVGGSVVVGVIDTGVDFTHPDLAANIWTNPNEIPGNGLDDDNNGYIDDTRGWDFANGDNNPMDGHGHGTHVAGTIAASGDNGLGVVGVAWDAQIMPLKFLSDSGGGFVSDAIDAVFYAAAMGAHITNNSWGGGGFSQALFDAIAASHQAGVLFVAAAGNDGFNNDFIPHYPSSYDIPNVVAVAATDHSDQLASFSNFGVGSVDLAAPGVSIFSTWPGAGYTHLQGTSMATPHVAGAAALILAQTPGLDPATLKQRLLAAVDDITWLNGVVASGGRLNIDNALQQTNGSIPWLSVDPLGGTISPGTSLAVSLTFAPDPSLELGTVVDGILNVVHNAGYDGNGAPLPLPEGSVLPIQLQMTLSQATKLVIEPPTQPLVFNVPFEVTVTVRDDQGQIINGVDWVELGANQLGVELPPGKQALINGAATFLVKVPLDAVGADRSGLVLTASHQPRALFGQSPLLTVAAPAIDPPDGVVATDFPNDNGEHIQLTFPYSDNHPGSAAAAGNALLQHNPIDYYQIYRHTTNDLGAALAWAFVQAVPIPSGGPTQMEVVVPTRGSTDPAYYWVVAVKGPLPATPTGSNSAIGPTAGKPLAVSSPLQQGLPPGARLSAPAGPAQTQPIDNFSRGNLNRDRRVDRRDFVALLQRYQKPSFDPLFDLNGDQQIDPLDAIQWAAYFGDQRPNAEPLGLNAPSGANANGQTGIRLVRRATKAEDLSLALWLEAPLVAAFEAVVSYDPTAYTLDEAHLSDALGATATAVTTMPSPGQLHFLAGSTGLQPVPLTPEQTPVALLHFTRLGPTTQAIRLEQLVLVDSTGGENELLATPVALRPAAFGLMANSPNPFNPETLISYQIAASGPIRLAVYNAVGQRIRTLVDDIAHQPGFFSVLWDGRSDSGEAVSSGLYFSRLETPARAHTRKMLLLK